ncbi:hypothetical protein [Streptomyces sp. NPDC059788]|uniref:hypothetical protein n=1 Tax=Streptomyces sp. NPDC059788 TaxID=3346948 RepID=UPI00365F0EF0
MSAVPAPFAAVRLPRTVVVRRALLAGLFLAGFVALGFAFGGGAHAADRPESVEPQLGAAAPKAPVAGAEAGREVQRGGRSATDALAGTPVGKAVRPVAERTAPTAGQATEPVTAPVRDAVREVRRAGEPGSLPVELPGGIPGVDGDRDGDGGDDHGHGPGHGDGVGERPGQGSGSRDGAGSPHAGAADQQVGAGAEAAECASAAARARVLGDASPRAAQHAGSASERQPGQGQGGLPGQLPQGPAPTASHTAGDGHGPRGGDQFAAVPAHPAHFGLAPGGVRVAAEPPTRQCAADILEFPG